MTNTLIIFIDSFPYLILSQTPFLNSMPQKWAIEPGFGYSVNIHAELFAGLLPDDIGYFGEWMYNPQKSPGYKLKPFLPFLDGVFRPYFLNRGLQHLLTYRYAAGHPMPNIPLKHLDKFALEGMHIQSPNFPHPTLFTQFPELHALIYRGIGKVKGERDAYLFEQGLAAVEIYSNLFVPLPDLDGFGHKYGVEAEPYLEHLHRVDSWCQQLSEAFFAKNESGHMFVVSDHGMVNVEQGVYLDIEENIGRVSEQTYLYFSDANLLRVWVFDQSFRSTIEVYLENFGHGQILMAAEREKYGLTSRRFGDFIYVLNEGFAFRPSTFARNIPKGMHGYHAQAPNQKAIALYAGQKSISDTPTRMGDIYRLMHQALSGVL